MDINDFKKSEYFKAAEDKNSEKIIRESFPKWKKRVKDSQIKEKATDLYNMFCNAGYSVMDKILTMGALIYILTPIDLIPDFIPFIGYMDDIGVAVGIITYVLSKKRNESSPLENTDKKSIITLKMKAGQYSPSGEERIGPFDDILISTREKIEGYTPIDTEKGPYDDIEIRIK